MWALLEGDRVQAGGVAEAGFKLAVHGRVGSEGSVRLGQRVVTAAVEVVVVAVEGGEVRVVVHRTVNT